MSAFNLPGFTAWDHVASRTTYQWDFPGTRGAAQPPRLSRSISPPLGRLGAAYEDTVFFVPLAARGREPSGAVMVPELAKNFANGANLAGLGCCGPYGLGQLPFVGGFSLQSVAVLGLLGFIGYRAFFGSRAKQRRGELRKARARHKADVARIRATYA